MWLLRKLLLILLANTMVLLPLMAWSEEQNVRPGINQYYQNPDYDYWVSIFENPAREIFNHRQDIVDALSIGPGMRIADIGAGTGFFSVLFAQKTGPTGTVYAVDIAEEFVQQTLQRSHEKGLDNVQGVVNTAKSVNLPEHSIDLAFICDTYHHFEYPLTTLQSIRQALKPGGEVVIIDFKKIPGFSSSWVMGHVRADQQAVIEEIESQDFKFVEAAPVLRRNYFLRFVKP